MKERKTKKCHRCGKKCYGYYCKKCYRGHKGKGSVSYRKRHSSRK